MSDAPDSAEPTTKSYTLEQVKEALPALMAAGPDVMPGEKRSRLLMGALAALALAADKGSGGGLTAEIVADVELAGKVCGELVRAFRAAPAAEPAAPATVESGQTADEHTTVAAGKAEGLSDNDLRDAIRAALAEKFPPEENEGDSPWHVWIIDVFRDDSTVVYELRSEKFQLSYTYDAGTVTLTGEPIEVRVSYKPVGEEEAPPAEGEPGAEMAPEPTETEQSADGAAKTAKAAARPATVIPLNLSEAYRKRQEAAAASQ